MKVKIDTKEKFHVITPQEPVLSANMTEEFEHMLLPFLEKNIKNIILKMNEVKELDPVMAKKIVNLQQEFQSKNASLVICELQKPVVQIFEQNELLDVLNHTPTESEAWDIVQMEEIEREFLD